MSNLIPVNTQVPAHLAARIGQPSALAQSLAGGLGGGGDAYPRISLKGSRFRIVEGKTETVLDTLRLDVIVVGANPNLSKAWFEGAWDANAEAKAPDCYSLDGIRPHTDSVNKQNDLCAGCPQNAWGSKITPTGAQVKACSDKKRLAIVAADDPTGPIYLLEVTPAALKGLNEYQKELAIRGIAPEIVQTRLSFDSSASFPKLVFGFGGFLDEETMLAVDDIFGSDKVKEITGEAVAAAPVALPPAVKKPAPLKVVEPEVLPPEPEEVVAEVEEAPAPRRGFGAKAAAAPVEKAAPKAAAPKAVAPKAAAKPAAAKPAAAGGALADEIANMLGEMEADDS